MSSKISDRVSNIFKTYYPAKLNNKSLNLEMNAGSYVAGLFQGHEGQYHISSSKILRLCQSYYLDIIRYKEYHMSPKIKEGIALPEPYSKEWAELIHHEKLGSKINPPKIAAFTSKWFLKSLPIYIIPKDTPKEKLEKQIFAINEQFLVKHVCDLMKIDIQVLDPSEIKNLIYAMKFRNFDEAAYILIYTALWDKHGDKTRLSED
jgi:hypothetical protein